MTKPKTQAQLDRETDQRLIKKYGVGLGWYESQLRLQNGGCAICGSTPKTRALHIDHDHGYTKVKITTQKIGKTWGASATYQGVLLGFTGAKRGEVVKLVKDRLKLMSVRGLLCFPHNAGLRKFSDNPKWMRAAAEYLEKHQGIENGKS